MPWSVTWHPDAAEIRYRGLTTGGDILEAKRQFFSRKFDGPARYVLCDFSDIQRFEVSPLEVHTIIAQDRAALFTHPELAEAVVAIGPLEYGLARTWQIEMQGTSRRTLVARTRAEAIAWLESLGAESFAA